MTRKEHLLTIFAEECAEVAQRVSKALRFGMDEIEPGQERTNGERINQEFTDLNAIREMLQSEGIIPPITEWAVEKMRKKLKVEKFLRYSDECGTLSPENAELTHPESK